MKNPKFEVDYYKLDNFDFIPSTTGIYSWYLTCNSTNYKNYYDFYKSESYSAFLKGNLLQNFQGKLLAQKTQKFEESENYFDDQLLEKVSSNFSPPIYIGISTDLHERLNTHKKRLQNHLNDISKITNLRSGFRSKADSDKESEVFAQRLAKLLMDSGNLYESNLLVKIIYIEKKRIKKDVLLNIENFLNRTYHPLLGRN